MFYDFSTKKSADYNLPIRKVGRLNQSRVNSSGARSDENGQRAKLSFTFKDNSVRRLFACQDVYLPSQVI